MKPRNPLDPLGTQNKHQHQAQQQQKVTSNRQFEHVYRPEQQPQQPPLVGEELKKMFVLREFIEQYQQIIFLGTVVVLLLCIFLLLRLSVRSFVRKLWGTMNALRQKYTTPPPPLVGPDKKYL
jgi:hypothetical protein